MFFDMDAATQYLAAEFAPANTYEAESAAYYRRWRLACAVARGLSSALGHAERLPVKPGRAEHEAHLQDVAEFARLARKALEADASWQPSGMYLRWLAGRGVQVSEVMELVGTDRKEAA